MLDFIKLEMTIENQHMNIGGQAPAAAAEDDAGAEQFSTRSYNSGQTITDEEQLEDAYDKFQQKSDDPELHSITRSRKISHISVKMSASSEPASISSAAALPCRS